MNAYRRRRTGARRSLIWALLAASVVSGCVGGGGYNPRLAGPTPPDPPPIPARKPWPQAEMVAETAAPAPKPRQHQVTAVHAVAIEPAPVQRPPLDTLVAYAVQPGDTVYGIGRRLSVPLRSIIDANELRPPYILRTGQVLRIPNPRRHVVVRGDTVYGIARRYQVDLTELVRLNRVASPFTIAPGQELILPVTTPEPATAVATWAVSTAPRVAAAAPTVTTSPPLSPVPSVTVPAATPPAAPGLVEKSLEAPAQTAALRPPPKPAVPSPPAAVPAPPPRGGSTFLWPLRGRLLTSYGPKDGGLHNDGINIAAPRGTPVRAADNGVVAYVGNELRGFGNLILIKHADGWVTAYAHADSLLVQRGDTVTRGQPIARVGSTGNVSDPQLHFEIRQGTRAVDPMRLLDPQKTALGGQG